MTNERRIVEDHAQGVPPSAMLCSSHMNQFSEFERKKKVFENTA
jgi:hypothetical protein